MKLVYNIVINSHIDKVWSVLENLENQAILVDEINVEKDSPNTFIFHIKNKFRTKSYHAVLLDKEDRRRISFCMVNKNLKITKTYFLSNNGIETYIKHYTKIQADNWFKKLITYPFYSLSFRKNRDAEFKELQKQCLKRD